MNESASVCVCVCWNVRPARAAVSVNRLEIIRLLIEISMDPHVVNSHTEASFIQFYRLGWAIHLECLPPNNNEINIPVDLGQN